MTTGNSETLHRLLKKQTSDLHEKAHQIAYISSLLKNDIPLESYVGHLRAFAIIYGTLEHQISTTKHSEIKDFMEGYTLKLPLILADLEVMNASTIKDIIPAVSIALHIADRILLFSEKNPYKLIGFLYTLDGSLNGGSVFKKHLSEIFGLQNDKGTAYFSAYNGQFKKFWKDFTGKLDTQISEKQAREDVLSASNEIFNNIMDIYERLYPATVYADREMISTVLRNLISNAIKFTHVGGHIVVSAEQKESQWQFEVHDNGVGISKNSIEKLFRIDESISTAGTEDEAGTGLGLILCKEFIEKHSGKIRVESEPGKGSSFFFTIPSR